ncbi:MAG: serine acetyltransferase [Holophaga sp.]|nr:serine acetyltransferase [Holophaga sp.]
MNQTPSRNDPTHFQDLVTAIVTSDLAEPRTRHIDAGYLPNRDSVIEIVKLMRELLFPGYFGRQHLTSSTLEFHVEELLRAIDTRLFEQARNAIRHHAARRGVPCVDCDEEAERIVRSLLAAIPRLRAILATDVQAAFDGDPAAADFDEIIFSYPGLLAIATYRVAHELSLNKLPLIPRIMTEYAHNVTGIDIHPAACIEESFFIDHGTGVVIGETTIIGKRAKIYQGVTLGALSTRGGQTLRGAKRHPTLMDEVTVYSGASILGGETVIGEGAVIASNVFLTQSVPARTRVSGKNPELMYKNHGPVELHQAFHDDWVI